MTNEDVSLEARRALIGAFTWAEPIPKSLAYSQTRLDRKDRFGVVASSNKRRLLVSIRYTTGITDSPTSPQRILTSKASLARRSDNAEEIAQPLRSCPNKATLSFEDWPRRVRL